MKTHELRDEWKVEGTDLKDFTDVLDDLTDSTYVVDARTEALSLLHFISTSPADPEKLMFSVHSKKQRELKQALGTSLDLRTLNKSGVSEEFVKELQLQSKLMLRLGNAGAQREDIYFASSHLSRDLAMRASLGGEAVYDPTEERDAYIMSRYAKAPMDAKIVIRRNSSENNAVHKVFAMPTAGYKHFDQHILLDMLHELETELGEAHCQVWTIDHFLTQIWLTFPDKAEDMCKVYGLPETLTPGVLLETSDTGDCSVRAVAFWERSPISHARIGLYEREHRGKITNEDILNGMHKELMPRYTELPNRLCELLTIDLNDPVAAVESVVHMAHIKKLLGKKRTENLVDVMTTLVSGRTSMTGYELAMLFIDMPRQFVMDENIIPIAEEIAGKVPFLDFEKIAKATTAVTLA